MKSKKQYIYIELLRIISIIFVLFNHTNGHGFFLFATTDKPLEWIVSITLSVLCKTAVPIFFMISGFLLINKDENLLVLFKKRIIRYIFILFLSCGLYFVTNETIKHSYNYSIREIIKSAYRGDMGTYWFIYAYIGLLIMLPFIRSAKESFNSINIKYLLILRYIVIGILPCLSLLFLKNNMTTSLSSLIFEESIFYFILGSYYGNRESSFHNNKEQYLLLVASIISIAISITITYYEFCTTGSYSERFLAGLLPPVCIYFFCLHKHYNNTISPKLSPIILFLGNKTFGIYLLEPTIKLIIRPLYDILLNIFPDMIASFIWIMTIFILGVIMTWIIQILYKLLKSILIRGISWIK